MRPLFQVFQLTDGRDRRLVIDETGTVQMTSGVVHVQLGQTKDDAVANLRRLLAEVEAL